MANYTTLKTAIQNVIKTNGNNEITGALLQQSLFAMINSLGADYQFAGIAEPSTSPGTPDQRVFYLATTPGNYTNFGGLQVASGELAVLLYGGDWSKQRISLGNFSYPMQSFANLAYIDYSHSVRTDNYEYQESANYDCGWVRIFEGSETLMIKGAIPYRVVFFDALTPGAANFISSITGLADGSSVDIPEGAKLALINFQKATNPDYSDLRVYQEGAGASVEMVDRLGAVYNSAGAFGVVDGCFNESSQFSLSVGGVPYSCYIYPLRGIDRVSLSIGQQGLRVWFVKSYPVVGQNADYCSLTPAPIGILSNVGRQNINVPADAAYMVIGRVYATSGTIHWPSEVILSGPGVRAYQPVDEIRAFLPMEYASSSLGGCLVSSTKKVVSNPIMHTGRVRVTAQFGYRIDKIIFLNGNGIASVQDVDLNSVVVDTSSAEGMLPVRGSFDKFVIQMKMPDDADMPDVDTLMALNVASVSADDGDLTGLDFARKDLSVDNVLTASGVCYFYTDYDELDINIKFKSTSNIITRVIGYSRNGRANDSWAIFSDPQWTGSSHIDVPPGTPVSCNILKGKPYPGATTNVSRKLDFVVLRFAKTDNSQPSVQEVISGLAINEIRYKMKPILPNIDKKEGEVFFGGLKAVDNYNVKCDDFMVPRELGTYRICLPRYMSLGWKSGYNSNSNMVDVSVDGSTTLMGGDEFSFTTNARLKIINRLQFTIIGSSRSLPVSYVANLIKAGEIKVFISDVESDIITRNHTGERFVNGLEATSGRQYGMRDLPMIVHIGDIHSDFTRIKNAFEYARYLRAHMFVHSGDAPHRSYNDSGVDFLKDMDEKVQPMPLKATDIPFINVIGNHDAWNSGGEANVISSLIAPFASKYDYQVPSGKSYYYRDFAIPAPRKQSSSAIVYDNIRLIVLNITEGLNVQDKWNISQAQIDWFISTLENTPAGYGILVALHCPPDTLIKPSEMEGVTLKYHEDTFVCLDQFKNYDLAAASPRANPLGLLAYGFTGNPIVKIIDAFIGRGSITDTYQPDSSQATTISYSANFANVPASAEFIAYLCAHTHRDYICYAQNAVNPQLVLCITCGTASYGPYENVQGANSSDVPRGTIGITQDALNVYVIDRMCGRVGIARVGSDIDANGNRRDFQWLNYRKLLKFWLNDIECYCVDGQTWDEYIGATIDFRNAYLQDFYVQTGHILSRTSAGVVQAGIPGAYRAIKLNGSNVQKTSLMQGSHYTY